VAQRPLLVALAWIEAHCVIPDGFDQGLPFSLPPWQLTFLANHYDVRAEAKRGQFAPAFTFRRSLLIRPQKAGKGPLTAAQVCLEGVGPALFDGWAAGHELYVCKDNGCACGWVYEYETGEPMGTPWPTPLIQVTATSEEQTDNIYAALRPMIEKGPLTEVIPKTGEAFIRLPGGGRIDTVTSSARSRLGQRVTFVVQDETGIWTKTSGMVKVAETQRRGLAGMGGRSVETTNAYDPSENSVAQRTTEAASTAGDVYVDHVRAPGHLSYRNKQERRRIHKFVYAGSPWVDLDAIEAEATELLVNDPAQAERFFGNRIVVGSDAWLDEPEQWDVLARSDLTVPDGARIVLGFDGSMYDDHTAIRARWLDTPDGVPFAFTPRFADGMLTHWRPEDYAGEVPRESVQAAIGELFDRYDVIRIYADPELWQSELDAWTNRYGSKRVIVWPTYRARQMSAALERLKTDIATGALTHDGDETMALHIRNARRVRRPGGVVIGKPAQHQKIDAVIADALAHEAAGDVVAAGLDKPRHRGRMIVL